MLTNTAVLNKPAKYATEVLHDWGSHRWNVLYFARGPNDISRAIWYEYVFTQCHDPLLDWRQPHRLACSYTDPRAGAYPSSICRNLPQPTRLPLKRSHEQCSMNHNRHDQNSDKERKKQWIVHQYPASATGQFGACLPYLRYGRHSCSHHSSAIRPISINLARARASAIASSSVPWWRISNSRLPFSRTATIQWVPLPVAGKTSITSTNLHVPFLPRPKHKDHINQLREQLGEIRKHCIHWSNLAHSTRRR